MRVVVLFSWCLSWPLLGCAGVNWERSIYEGLRFSADTCRTQRDAQAASCPKLPAHATYEAERTRLRTSAPSAAAASESAR